MTAHQHDPARDARETPARLSLVAAWREATVFTEGLAGRAAGAIWRQQQQHTPWALLAGARGVVLVRPSG